MKGYSYRYNKFVGDIKFVFHNRLRRQIRICKQNLINLILHQCTHFNRENQINNSIEYRTTIALLSKAHINIDVVTWSIIYLGKDNN